MEGGKEKWSEGGREGRITGGWEGGNKRWREGGR